MPCSWRRLGAHDEAGGSLGDPLLVDIRQIVDPAQRSGWRTLPRERGWGAAVVPKKEDALAPKCAILPGVGPRPKQTVDVDER
jgi:hypothetical protein